MITQDQRRALRAELGRAVLQIQARRSTMSVQPWNKEEFITELLTALLSLSALLAQQNAMFDRDSFLACCETAAREQWKIRQH